ncbi:hypothetical protein [Ferruginibacter sp. SUN106]|uniref:FEKKY domain-containing protein n=1 Tax=Ferruginibacter sp. SUN106 TaxID=2978348 RepID=UPI003D36C099
MQALQLLHLDKKLMRQLFFLMTFFASVSSFGQNTFKGQILSIVDGSPLTNFHFRVDKKKLDKTDSLGFFSITTEKNKVRLSTIFGIYGFDTTLKNSNGDNLKLYTIQNYDSTLADFDIRQNKFRLFCGVAFAPLAPMPSDKDFEKEYHTSYYIVGDFLPSSIEQMTAYNKVVAEYLDKKYGKEWRAKVRPDVLGVTNKNGR